LALPPHEPAYLEWEKLGGVGESWSLFSTGKLVQQGGGCNILEMGHPMEHKC
jgi:hypothetical protein